MITQEELKEVLEYDPATGEFRWRVSRGPTAKAGNRAGSLHHTGYRMLRVYGHRYLEHRLAWLYMTGNFPAKQVDHRNLIRDDNSWDNLREASQGQNKANGHKYQNNTSGYKGAYKCGKRWRSGIKLDNKQINLGTFDSAKEAHLAYCKAATEMRREFARHE